MANQTVSANTQRGPVAPAVAPHNPYFGLLPREFAGRLKDPFVYNIVVTVGAATTNAGSTQIQNDSDFVWTQGTVVVTDNTGLVFTNAANVPGLISISDSASGRVMSDQAVAISGWFGTAQLPFFLQAPKVFRAGGQVNAQVQNLSAGALTFRFSFHGFKVFAMPAQ